MTAWTFTRNPAFKNICNFDNEPMLFVMNGDEQVGVVFRESALRRCDAHDFRGVFSDGTEVSTIFRRLKEVKRNFQRMFAERQPQPRGWLAFRAAALEAS